MVNLHFPNPMTVSSMGMVMSGTLSFVCCHLLGIVEARNQVGLKVFITKVSALIPYRQEGW